MNNTNRWISITGAAATTLNKRVGELDFPQMTREDLPFCHHCFRQSFDVEAVPEEAVVHIAARSLYKCHVNGKFVMFGPARSPAGYLFADSFDIAPHLRTGRNLIAVEVVYAGPLTEYDFGDPGFRCQLPGLADTWKHRDWNAYAPSSEAGKIRWTYPGEKLDLNQIDLSWASPAYDDSTWEDAPVPSPAPDEIRPRPFPLPELKLMPPPQVVDCDGVLLDGCVIRLPRPGKNNHAILDFGRTVSGLFEISGKLPQGAVLSCVYLEWLDQFDGSSERAASKCWGPPVGFKLVGDGRDFKYQTFHPYSCRYLKVYLERGEGAEVHSVMAREVCSLPSARRAHALCSNPTLNRIVEAAQNTLRVCAPDMYVDCSSHERRIYLHDSLWEVEAGNIFFGDTAISQTFLDMVPDCAGRLERFPAMIQNGVLCSGGSAPTATLSHNLTWILQGFKHSEFTGAAPSPRFLKAAEGILADAAKATTPEGLIGHDDGLCMFLDWSKMHVKHGAVTAMSALHYKALKALADALKSDELASRAAKLRSELRTLLVPILNSDGMRNGRLAPDLFVRNPAGQLVPLVSKHTTAFGVNALHARSETTQYWVLWSGVLEPAEERRLWEVLRGLRINGESRADDNRLYAVARSGLFGLWPRLAYAFERGDDEVVYRDLHDICQPMVALGDTLWESICADSRSNAHGYNAIAGTLLFKMLSGIMPGSSGYEKPVVAPRPSGFGLTWGRGFMRLGNGVLHSSWTLDNDLFMLRVSLPADAAAIVRLPPEAAAIAARGGHGLASLELEINGTTRISVSSRNGLELEPDMAR